MWCLCGKDYQTREGGKVRMNGNVRMWHVKGGLGGVKTPGVREMRSEALQETDLDFRCIVSPGAVGLGHQGAWAAG